MPKTKTKTKSKTKRRVKRKLKKIGYGRNMYGMKQGNMGRGGPHYLHEERIIYIEREPEKSKPEPPPPVNPWGDVPYGEAMEVDNPVPDFTDPMDVDNSPPPSTESSRVAQVAPTVPVIQQTARRVTHAPPVYAPEPTPSQRGRRVTHAPPVYAPEPTPAQTPAVISDADVMGWLREVYSPVAPAPVPPPPATSVPEGLLPSRGIPTEGGGVRRRPPPISIPPVPSQTAPNSLATPESRFEVVNEQAYLDDLSRRMTRKRAPADEDRTSQIQRLNNEVLKRQEKEEEESKTPELPEHLRRDGPAQINPSAWGVTQVQQLTPSPLALPPPMLPPSIPVDEEQEVVSNFPRLSQPPPTSSEYKNVRKSKRHPEDDIGESKSAPARKKMAPSLPDPAPSTITRKPYKQERYRRIPQKSSTIHVRDANAADRASTVKSSRVEVTYTDVNGKNRKAGLTAQQRGEQMAEEKLANVGIPGDVLPNITKFL